MVMLGDDAELDHPALHLVYLNYPTLLMPPVTSPTQIDTPEVNSKQELAILEQWSQVSNAIALADELYFVLDHAQDPSYTSHADMAAILKVQALHVAVNTLYGNTWEGTHQAVEMMKDTSSLFMPFDTDADQMLGVCAPNPAWPHRLIRIQKMEYEATLLDLARTEESKKQANSRRRFQSRFNWVQASVTPQALSQSLSRLNSQSSLALD